MIKDWQDIPGFFDFQDVYDQAVAESQDGDTLIEVGTFLGKSAAYLSEKVRESGKNLKLFAVDPWDDKDYANWWVTCNKPYPHPWPVPELIGKTLWNAFRLCMDETGSSVSPIRNKSEAASLLFEDGSASFVFIDADHRYRPVKNDIAAWLPKVRPGGIIAGHDYRVPDWPGVARAVDESFPAERVEHRVNSWLVRV